MALILLGLNYRTSPLEMRERLSFPGDRLATALYDLQNNYLLEAASAPSQRSSAAGSGCEVVILSTCNRLEIYAVVRDIRKGWEAIEQFLMQQGSLRWGSLYDHLYRQAGHGVVEHLMRVAAGLDSMILGEPQILGQVADAFTAAQQSRTSGMVLSHLFAEALHTGKRVYTDTTISRHTTSASHAAIQLIKTRVEDLAMARILLVGAGETALLAARALQMHHVEQITCINRTQARAEHLAARVQGQALPWQALPEALIQADVLISTTSAPGVLLRMEDIRTALAGRQERPLIIMDLAVPRDVDSAVASLPGVYLYNIDDLQAALDKNLALRQAAIPHVEAILKTGVEDFLHWLHGRQVVPVLTSFRKQVADLADVEVKQALSRIEGLNQQGERAVIQAVRRVVNKLLHRPTERLKAHAASGESLIYVQALQDLFALDPLLTENEPLDCPCSNFSQPPASDPQVVSSEAILP
jgi:glutamyl-tRNA reductase